MQLCTQILCTSFSKRHIVTMNLLIFQLTDSQNAYLKLLEPKLCTRAVIPVTGFVKNQV